MSWSKAFGGLALGALLAAGSSCHRWETVAEGEDCTGTDVQFTCTGAIPDPELCPSDKNAVSAVCWDGVKFKNGSPDPCGPGDTKAWCAYKTTENCTGGGNPGVVYRCK